MELDDFLLARTVCKIVDADEAFPEFKRAEARWTNIRTKIIRSLGAETQLLTWAKNDIVLFDTTTVEYANNIFDVMMSAEVDFAERQQAMRSLLYKQWARSLFLSGFNLQSWLLLGWSRRNDEAISYSNDTTRISGQVDQNLKESWQLLFRGFLFAHELGHVLQKRSMLDQKRYDQFLAAKVEAARGPSDNELAERKQRVHDGLQSAVNAQERIPGAAKSGIVEMFAASLEKPDDAAAARPIDDALRVELLCDLHACEFIIDNYDIDEGGEFAVCYLLPICVAVISFLKIGLKNRLWVEHLHSHFESLKKEHGETEAGKMMDAVVEDSYDSEDSMHKQVEDNVVRLFAISDFMIDAFNGKRNASAKGASQPRPPLNREEILPRFMTQVWGPYQYLMLGALDETNTQWLNAIFTAASHAEEAARSGRLDAATIGLPYSKPLRYEDLGKAVREQFLRENGF